MKTSTITSVKFNKETNNEHWLTYYFDIELENWDKWSIWSKSRDWIQMGVELNYEISTNAKWFTHIKKVSPKFEQQTTPTNTTPTNTTKWNPQLASFALSYSKDLASAWKIEIWAIEMIADQFYVRLTSKC